MPVAPRALDERFEPTSLSSVASFNRRAEVVFEAQVVLVGVDLRRHRLVVAVHVSKASPRRTVTMAEPLATFSEQPGAGTCASGHAVIF